MKKDIHPQYNSKTKITCACGNVIKTGSTSEKLETEICSACHPFFTGKKKIVDSTGRVDRFKKLAEKSAAKKKSTKNKSRTAKKKKVQSKKKSKK